MNNSQDQISYYLYIIYSRTVNRFYVGITQDLNRRLFQHNNGLSSYTKNKGPWELVYQEVYNSKTEAMKREREIKSWKSREKIMREFKIKI